MIITFSGVDCAGKSTQIKALENYYISQGKTVKVFWYRPGYSKEMEFGKKIIRKVIKFGRWAIKHAPLIGTGHPQKLNTEVVPTTDNNSAPTADQTAQTAKQNANLRAPAPLWLTTAFVDTALQWAMKLRYYARRYDVVICDRFIDDARLDLLFKFPQYRFTDEIFDRLALILPKPAAKILLWLPFDEMVRRVEAKNEPFPDPPELRERRYRAYENLTDAIRIDTSGPFENTHAMIRAAIEDKA